jgi:5'-nucleotidase
MQILVTNDDGILSERLWILAEKLSQVGQVTIVAPDRERSAIGTAVSLRQPLRIRQVNPVVAGVEAYSVDGTPSDSVILGLGKLISGKVDLVVSGINLDYNLGEDIHISGTVSAALQAYLMGIPAIAVSAPYGREDSLDVAAGTVTFLAEKLGNMPDSGLFLNINSPACSIADIAGVKITRLASRSHVNTVEEVDNGRYKYYWLERQRLDGVHNSHTDVWAIEQGYISVTPLFADHSQEVIQLLDNLCDGLLQQVVGQRSS